MVKDEKIRSVSRSLSSHPNAEKMLASCGVRCVAFLCLRARARRESSPDILSIRYEAQNIEATRTMSFLPTFLLLDFASSLPSQSPREREKEEEIRARPAVSDKSTGTETETVAVTVTMSHNHAWKRSASEVVGITKDAWWLQSPQE